MVVTDSPTRQPESKWASVSRVRLLATPWTVAHQAPLSMEFSRLEYWSGLPCPSPGGLPDPGIEPRSPALQAVSLPSEPPGKPPGGQGCNFIWESREEDTPSPTDTCPQHPELPRPPLLQTCSENKASCCPTPRASPLTRREWSPPRQMLGKGASRGPHGRPELQGPWGPIGACPHPTDGDAEAPAEEVLP